MTTTLLSSFIDGSYSSVCCEYRNNPNPETIGGYRFPDSFFATYTPEGNFGRVITVLNEVFGEFYQIDPMSLTSTSDPRYYGEQILFRCKSKVMPYADDQELYQLECIEYWINSLQTS